MHDDCDTHEPVENSTNNRDGVIERGGREGERKKGGGEEVEKGTTPSGKATHTERCFGSKQGQRSTYISLQAKNCSETGARTVAHLTVAYRTIARRAVAYRTVAFLVSTNADICPPRGFSVNFCPLRVDSERES